MHRAAILRNRQSAAGRLGFRWAQEVRLLEQITALPRSSPRCPLAALIPRRIRLYDFRCFCGPKSGGLASPVTYVAGEDRAYDVPGCMLEFVMEDDDDLSGGKPPVDIS